MERRRGVWGRLAGCLLLLVMVYSLLGTRRLVGGEDREDTDVKVDLVPRRLHEEDDQGDTDVKDDLVESTETLQRQRDGESNAEIAGEAGQMETTRRRNDHRLHHLKTACQEVSKYKTQHNSTMPSRYWFSDDSHWFS